ncbi:MAG TPA: response regulator [Bacillota bacterium]|nr:response regulator [Bacillota bacterium]
MKQNRTHGKSVLVVDDELSVLQALKLVLTMDHYTVTPASNGAEALALYAANQFDLVITDFNMPLMKGDELASRIKGMAPSQPILMITGYGNDLDSSYNPVDAILTKPFRVDELREAIASLLAPESQTALLATA